ncbi:hypothetical protein BWZ22_14465 [Seonamhaeicola sp. S2-3]|uniref:hypothetical protein n=1 Tax=Seonamhaeicola sp. S2-3 TaxID=1936081 RepID=UPI000972915E|nr:hypothetical protein [Seonamhaeicola sp. S2-3]APY12352.1 hypothetical protein BWZ22_14465 [Seonamhaeicola sp. S2-3]
MKFFKFTIILLLGGFYTEAQNIDFVFHKEFSTLIAEKEGSSPYAYEILNDKDSYTITIPAKKRLTDYYKKTLAFYKKAQNDSLKIAQLRKSGKSSAEINKVINIADVNNRLATANRILKSAKKYERIPSKVVTKKENKLKIRRNLFKPETIILGNFKHKGSYYVTKAVKGYMQGDLVPVDLAKEQELTTDDFLLKNVFEVIQNINTEVMYMVYPDFLSKYPINVASYHDVKTNLDVKINNLIKAYRVK